VSYGAIYLGLRGYLARIGADRVRANRERFQAVQEAFGGIKDIKVAGLEAGSLHRFDGPSKRFAKRQAALQIANQLPRFLLEAVAFGGALAFVLYLLASRGGLQGVLPVMAVYALAGYKLLPALQQVYSQVANLKFAEPAVVALHADLTQLRPSPTLELPPPAPLGLSRSLALENVSYTYPGAARPTLERLDLEVAARTTVGLVGATGSGKTTTVDLLLGLLEPKEGRLLVDGAPVGRRSLRAWQRTIGYVPQHIFLTDDTVAANIGFGLAMAQIDMAAVERAATTASLHDFVVKELPSGYDTLVGERGVRLSGGQRQRIGIARALYHDPSLLILDEATNSLDSVTEQAVVDAVHKLGRRKTIIIIAHRLTTVRNCDQIFLLDRGRVTAQGTFGELLESSARFRRMATGRTLA
jgi:ATP-binding cassette, subfamily B, bacterial PglK